MAGWIRRSASSVMSLIWWVTAARLSSVVAEAATFSPHTVHNGVNTDRVRDVLDVIHQHPDTDQRQNQGSSDRQSRDKNLAILAWLADSEQSAKAVREGGHKDTQDKSGTWILEKRAEQTRRELGRRELKGHHSEHKHESGNGDHRPRHHHQQLTSRSYITTKQDSGKGTSIANLDSGQRVPEG